MGIFTSLCRNVGLMIHHVAHPNDKPQQRELKRTVEQEKRGNVTLRRTTIEEIEFSRRPEGPRVDQSHDP